MSDPFSGLFDALCERRGIGCALTGADFVVRAVGGAKRVWGGLSPGDPITDALPELLGCAADIEASVAAGEAYLLPWINRPGGPDRLRFYELSIHRHPDEADLRVHWLVDVTAAGRLESALNQERNVLSLTRDALDLRNRDLQVFLRAAGHDLKSPLRTLEGFLELVAAEQPSPLVDASLSLAGQLAELVSALLDYAQLGERAVEVAPVAVDDAVQRALDRLALPIAERGAVIERPAALPVVLGERTLLAQALYNLLDNALKYAGAERAPRVRISAEPLEGRVRLAVEDDGPGIPAGARARVFEPLVRLVGGPGGHGFGLATVRRCVELMRGRVAAVEPRASGGARFEIELPTP